MFGHSTPPKPSRDAFTLPPRPTRAARQLHAKLSDEESGGSEDLRTAAGPCADEGTGIGSGFSASPAAAFAGGTSSGAPHAPRAALSGSPAGGVAGGATRRAAASPSAAAAAATAAGARSQPVPAHTEKRGAARGFLPRGPASLHLDLSPSNPADATARAAPGARMLPLSSSGRVAVGGGGGGVAGRGTGGSAPTLRQWHSPLRKWVWTCFALNVALGVIFAALCASSYKAFTSAVDQLKRGDAGFPAGSKPDDWKQLFGAAAVSAAFAILLTVLFHAGALILLLCSFKSLADPGRRFGRAVVMASALFVGLHVLNIALQFRGYGPTLAAWRRDFGAPFNPALLNACVVFGLTSFLSYTLLAGLILFWQDPVDVYLLDRSPAGPGLGPGL
ncbi:hypothetical protein HYH03_015889 [Edaphochlamys debaryana]|uniref:Uncharacterized protein n=1 Tax=Edaphochlamys debaryana TaxID=47281 RepID=A0A835XJS8_9CHLO|nr:hypothetical protein HYH03_015889 [Edaphochlamys debaryana]|eukprot:KAG2485403.1 hypothetical protein HYH03_015889 [Edaphochlamys debaryana]